MATKKNQPDKAAAAAKRAARQARNERAKALAEERRRAQKRKERLTLAGVVLGVLVLVVGGFLAYRAINPDKPTTPPEGATDGFGLRLGEEDAPKTVVIYEDFLCPPCGALEQAASDRLDAAVEAGEMSVEYRPVAYLEQYGDYSKEAANAFAVVLDAAGPETAKEFHDLLFADQPTETGEKPGDDELVDLAVEAGAEEADVRPGIEDMAFEGWVEAGTEEASKDGINQTPSVLVDGDRVEFETIAELVTAIFGSAG